jgi:hypothetical protein
MGIYEKIALTSMILSLIGTGVAGISGICLITMDDDYGSIFVEIATVFSLVTFVVAVVFLLITIWSS